MPMVPRHIYEGTDYLNNPANNTPIGTGPYKFRNGGAARTSSWCATSSTTRPACPASTRCTST